MAIANLPKLVRAAPAPAFAAPSFYASATTTEEGKDPDEAGFWIYVGVAFTLVMFGGVFAGLTLGLMGQDEIYLQVMQQSGDDHERKNATKVLRLLKRGKHWVLVTLLLSNVITNETLPIVLDRSLGGGWPAVLSSTVLIVIFGEIIPQSVCVRYGLGVGALFSPFVLALMYLMYPVAYPTALLLDYILGEDHGTVYKKAGLKTLVTLHKSLGPHPSERLNQDEVTIISAVLDLKEKPVGAIMTPIKDVFTMSSDTLLDEPTMDAILSAGYSRIPIHAPGEPTNFVGMLLVKVLITYDPDDARPVGEFPLATLPETAEDTSCLDIVNFFQEGKSHMVLVSASPGENKGALGVVTLEDVIEELIGEEIVDESDVYIDVHKAIRRLHPSPLTLSAGTRRTISAGYMARSGGAGAGADAQPVASTASAMAGHSVPPGQTAQAQAVATADLLIATDPPNQLSPPSSPPVGELQQQMELQQPRQPQQQQQQHSGSAAADAAESARGRKHSAGRVGGLSDGVMAYLTLGPANRAGRPRETTSKTVKIKHVDPSRRSEDVARGHHFNHHRHGEGGGGGKGGGGAFPGRHDGPSDPPAAADGRPEISEGGRPPSAPAPAGYRKKARTGSLIERTGVVDSVPKTVIEITSSTEDTYEPGSSSPLSPSPSPSRRHHATPTETSPLLDKKK